MRVAVVGLGGVGGYLAAKFAQAGIDVVGFARGEHLRAIQQDGIRVNEDESSFSVALSAQELREAKGHFDVVLFCVKSYDLEESYRAISPCVSEETVLVSFSNGVDNGDRLRALSCARVVDGMIYILSHRESPGVIRKKGSVFAAVFGGEREATERLAELFERAKLRYKIPDDIQKALWKKYIFIATFATLTSYYDQSIYTVYTEHRAECEALLGEIVAVAKSYGIDIEDEVQKALDTASKLPKDASTSMHLDFGAKKKSELESLTGFIAKREGVETPLFSKIYKALKERAIE
jgi:2-dehydropantoate 2-reductase